MNGKKLTTTKKKKSFPKFQSIQILRLQVMHYSIIFEYCPILINVLNSRQQDIMWKLLLFHTKMISA